MEWVNFSERQPEKNGWYICTVEVQGQQRYVMDLYWYSESERFKDNRVQHVFDMYDVHNYLGDRMLGNELCDRTESVVAWMELPETYMDGFVKYDYDLLEEEV